MFNRIDGFYAPPDTLLERASGIKLELVRFPSAEAGDVDTLISFEVHGELTDDEPLLAKLLAQFAGKAGAQ